MDEILDGRPTRRLTIRVSNSTYDSLEDMAYAARIQLAVVARNLLIGRVVQPAPPLVLQLNKEQTWLLEILQKLRSNLSQIWNSFSKFQEEPSVQLGRQNGQMAQLNAAAMALGMSVKSGQVDGDLASGKVLALASPAATINDIAYRLNSGVQVPPAELDIPLTKIAEALGLGQK